MMIISACLKDEFRVCFFVGLEQLERFWTGPSRTVYGLFELFEGRSEGFTNGLGLWDR